MGRSGTSSSSSRGDKSLFVLFGVIALQVQPFASLIDQVPEGVPRLLINRERVGEVTQRAVNGVSYRGLGFDFGESNYRDALYLGDCDEGASRLAGLLGWGEELEAMVKEAAEKCRGRQQQAPGPPGAGPGPESDASEVP